MKGKLTTGKLKSSRLSCRGFHHPESQCIVNMPANKDFTFCILVGGAELPEYVNGDGQVFVESGLFTPYSYKLTEEGVVQGDTERQEIPVTPYKVKITLLDTTPTSRAFVLRIDGQMISGIFLDPGEKYVFDRFDDGKTVCEFLFSLPRFPTDENDRMDKTIISHIGKVEVLCFSYTWQRIEKTTSKTSRSDFKQASKKDSYAVTKGDYVMVTTRKGKILDTPPRRPCKVHEGRNDDTSKKHSGSDMGTPLTKDNDLKITFESALSVKYVMMNALKDMGFDIKPENEKNDEETKNDSKTGPIETIQADESDDDITLIKISNPNTKRRRMKPGPENVIIVD